MELEIAQKFAEIDQREKSNTHRIDKLEKDNEALNKMASSIELLAYRLNETNDKVDRIENKVTAIEKAPGENLSRVLWYIVGALCSAGVGSLITYFVK